MKLAALQLMQQKAGRMESPSTLENGDSLSSESKPEDPPGPEAGSEEEGGGASGLAKVKELAETIASDDGTGGAAVDVGKAKPASVLAVFSVWIWGEARGRVAPPTAGGGALPPSRPCLHSRPSKPGGDPQRLQGSWLH